MEKIVVHICCGVDSVYALRLIKEQFPDKEIVGFFYDPNIHPEQEYELRWLETKRVCDSLGIDCIKGDYELELWMSKVKGYENDPERGDRCSICHDLRLEKSAELAKDIGASYLTTVLMMSPKKDFEVLREIGQNVAGKYGINFLSIDFRKNGGTEKMNTLSRQFQLYHQNYCGCLYGLFGQKRNLEFYPQLLSFSKGRLAGSTEELLFIKQIRLFAQNLGLECYEQQFSFISWRILSSTLKVNNRFLPHKVLPYSTNINGVLRDKINSILESEDRTVYLLYKSTTQIWKVKNLESFEYSELRYNTDPVFIIQDDLNLDDKVQIELKTVFDPSARSQNLIIGNIDAKEREFFHSDTEYYDYLSGYNLSDITDFIQKNQDKIREGNLLVVIFGANYAGKAGERVFYSLDNRHMLSM